MSYPKRAVLISILLAVFLFVYIRQVKIDRHNTIENYFGSPKIGDIYKIRYKNIHGATRVQYFKVADLNAATLFLFRGKLTARAIDDTLLDAYETDHEESFSRADMEKMKRGSFSNGEMYNASLLSIERR